ncbi:MAG: DUF1194 domain-containing protein [Rhizobiaceae bacterium]|nr:DUF1194 domain-containing protein [Rhizobiaceae bacterium]
MSATAAASEPVDVELVLAVDISSSMTLDELVLQRQGYVAAFRSPEVANAIRDGVHGRVAVTYVEWGASGSRRIVVPWTLIGSPSDALRMADALEQAPVKSLYQTSISGAIRFGQRAINGNEFTGIRRVIDISGDGPNNQGGLVTASRDVAVSDGITINGLPLILGDRAFGDETLPDLDVYYADCVIGGPRSFVLPVRSWDQFPEAVRRKLVLELAGGAATGAGSSEETARLWMTSGGTTDCSIGETLWRGWSNDNGDTN